MYIYTCDMHYIMQVSIIHVHVFSFNYMYITVHVVVSHLKVGLILPECMFFHNEQV